MRATVTKEFLRMLDSSPALQGPEITMAFNRWVGARTHVKLWEVGSNDRDGGTQMLWDLIKVTLKPMRAVRVMNGWSRGGGGLLHRFCGDSRMSVKAGVIFNYHYSLNNEKKKVQNMFICQIF